MKFIDLFQYEMEESLSELEILLKDIWLKESERKLEFPHHFEDDTDLF